MNEQIRKYPRTPHLEGSRLQPGDHDLAQIPLDDLRGAYVVVEEKLDGANAGISLDDDGHLRLQSRGHVLVGGPRERHWNLLKRWASAHAVALEALLPGLVLYGEWLYAKHTVFYDQLPHYLMEFDIFDGTDFWSTTRRRDALRGTPIVSVPVVWEGVLDDPRALPELVAPSLYKSARWRDRLREVAAREELDVERVVRETDPHDESEGLYIKVEADGVVRARYKWVRASFLTSVVDSGSHWLSRPIVPNQLADGVELFT